MRSSNKTTTKAQQSGKGVRLMPSAGAGGGLNGALWLVSLRRRTTMGCGYPRGQAEHSVPEVVPEVAPEVVPTGLRDASVKKCVSCPVLFFTVCKHTNFFADHGPVLKSLCVCLFPLFSLLELRHTNFCTEFVRESFGMLTKPCPVLPSTGQAV